MIGTSEKYRNNFFQEILNPVITGHKIVIISEQNKGEEIDALKNVFNQNEVKEEDIVVRFHIFLFFLIIFINNN